MIDLRLGDCLEVMQTLQDASIDAVITDPPYGIALQNHDKGKARRATEYVITGDNSPLVGAELLRWAEDRRLPTIAFASPWQPWTGKWRNLIVWDKGGAVGGGGDTKTCLKRSWELIQVARNGRLNNGRKESVWRFPITPQDTAEHIAAKPIDLMLALIETFTNKGDTIFDPFMGSGTTGVACAKLGRSFIGIEINPDYFAIAERRIQEAQAQMAMPMVMLLKQNRPIGRR